MSTRAESQPDPVEAGPGVLEQGELTYLDYLKVPQLLSLQVPRSSPPHHDEMLFIVIHQAYELWFKLILHELDYAILYMQQNQVLRAHHFMRRVVAILNLLVKQIHILETMTPAEFLQFRERLSPASGFQSIQFREIELVAGLRDRRYLEIFRNRPDMAEPLRARLDKPDLPGAYYGMLRNLGYAIPEGFPPADREPAEAERQAVLQALLQIYQEPDQNLALYRLSEALVDFDEQLALWRSHHVLVVERIIGGKPGTGGSSGVSYLASTLGKRCFPLLWEVRTWLEKP
jgi:tryptophan 2,3-dioxygenase